MWPAYVGIGVAGVGLGLTIIFAAFKADSQSKADAVATSIREAALKPRLPNYPNGYDGDFPLDVEGKRDETGKITRPTTTLRLSLIEAADGKGGSLLEKLTMLCYRYDALHQGYALNVLRAVQLGGIVTLLVVGTGVFLAFRRDWRKPKPGAALAAPDTRPTDALPSGGTA